MKLSKKIAVSLLGIVCTVSLACGLSACKGKKPVDTPENNKTVRLELPNDGSLPTAHTGIENIGYMATVLDRQPMYHAYAHNSSKAMGYEQVTQTWKEYKGKELSGYNSGVMICSDLSYSSLVKSGTQACFVNDVVYMRSSSKPGKSTTPTTADWHEDTPDYYDRESYLSKYGEYSTELSVYVLNEDTIEDYDDVVVNEDGTYSQTFYLEDEAACYYQNGMKTRGNLKGYPGFEYIDLTFTFDSNWQVLSTYCEEKTKIAPKSLGGVSMTSNSKTSTTFSYSESEFDAAHYAYFDSYFKGYVGADIKPVDPNNPDEEKPELLDVLAGGFSKVMDGGQQFALDIKIGETDYDGKIFLNIGDLSNALNTIDARVALEKEGSGKQDLYVEFKNGTVNAYYSDSFAVTANIDAVKTAVGQFSEWVKRFDNPDKAPASLTLAEEGGGFDLTSLLNSLEFTYGDTWAKIALNTDDLLGTGIGANVSIDFDRRKGSEGSTYSFRTASLSGLKYSSDTISLSGAINPDNTATITRNAPQTPADIAQYITSVHGLLNSNTVKVNLNFNGDNQNVISYLRGLDLSAAAYVELGSDIATKIDFTVSYEGVSAKLSAYYDVNIHGGNYGKVYLTLTELNGEAMNAKVYCDISDTVNAVKQLITTINGAQSGATPATLAEKGGAVNSLSEIVNAVLNLNFGRILGDLYASNSQMRVSVNIDELVSGIGIDVGGTKFGNAALVLNLDNDKKATLGLTLAALGLEMGVEGSTVELTEPDVKDYFDVTTLVNLVNTAAQEAKEIISAKDIDFDIETTVTVDDIPLYAKGKGEVSWVNGKIRVAVDLTLSVADGTSSANKDTVALKLVYDDTVNGDEKPLAKYSVNGIAMEIYRSDLTNLKNDINHIVTNIDKLINGEKQTAVTARAAVAAYSGVSTQSVDGTLATVEEILSNGNVQNILKAVLGFVGDFTVELGKTDGAQQLNKLVITHLKNGNLTLSADNGLQLALFIKNDNGTPIIDLTTGVKAGNGATLDGIRAELDKAEKTYTTSEASDAFATVIYNYLFAVIDDLSIENVLGSRTYTVNAVLNGDNSGISALRGIAVNATLYYTEGQQGTEKVTDRLTELDLDLNIKGTAVKANVRYGSDTVYVSLNKLNDTILNDISFKADRSEIYRVADTIIGLVMNDEFVSSVSGVIHPAKSAAAYSLTADNNNSRSAITDLLSKVLSLDFSSLISYTKVDGVNTAVVNVDGIVSALGVSAPAIGTVTVKIDPKTHKVEGGALIDGKQEWVKFSAEAAERRVYPENWENGYIDINFVANLIDDVLKTAVSANKLNTIYTLSSAAGVNGISININYSVISATINFTDVKLTAGFDENNKFYFTLVGNMHSSKYLTFTVSQEWKICVSYSDGYITMGRQVGTENEKYKVMTIDYLLTKLLDKSSSPVRWLLGTSDTAWGLICDNVKLNIAPDLTTPQEYWLYQQNAQTVEVEPNPAQSEGQKQFKLSDVISGMYVAIDGKESSSYGTPANIISKLGLTAEQQKNYYGLDLNLQPLIGNTLSNVYLAILRGAEGGLSGLKVNTTAAGALTVNVDLSNGVSCNRADAAVNYFDEVNAKHDINYNFYDGTEDPDTHITKTFGCYSTEYTGDACYDSLNALGKVTLTVVGYGDVVKSQSISLRSTSTVYLRDPDNILWANDEHTLMITFVDEAGNDLGTQMQLSRDITIRAKTVDAVEVTFDIGSQGDSYNKVFTPDEALPAYDKELTDKVFAYWADKNGTKVTVANAIALDNGTRTAYAVFYDKVKEIDGVKYSCEKDGDKFIYAVSGVAESGLDSRYTSTLTNGGAYLKLASSIDGIPVTKINDQALKGKNVKNVIVPESITSVGANAFSDNYAIESIIFYADTVNLGGTFDGKSYPFYGCSEVADGHTTILKLYYNNFTTDENKGNNGEGNPYWSLFRTFTQGLSTKHRYIGNISSGASDGGERHAAGTWSYVEYTQDGADLTEGLNCLVNGFKHDELSLNDIKAMVEEELNARTAAECVHAYTVTVTEANGKDGYSNDGKLHSITVTVTEEANPYYLVNIDTAGCIFTGDVKAYGGKNYAKAGTQVTVNAPDGYVFESLTGVEATADGDAYKFTMPSNALNLTATCKKAPVSSYTINSAVAFTYGGTSSVENKVELNVSDVAAISGTKPEAEGYTFLGWAYNNGTQLEFVTGETIEYSNYYAIWAANYADIIDGSVVNTTGTIPTMNYKEGKSATFIGWYADASYSSKVESLTLENTVLYAKLQFNLVLSLNGSNTDWYYTESANASEPTDLTYKENKNLFGSVTSWTINNGTKFGSGTCEFTLDLEYGNSVEVWRYWSNAIVIKVKDGDNYLKTYLIKGFNTKNSTSWRDQAQTTEHCFEFTSTGWTYGDGLDSAAANKYYKSGNDSKLFGTVSSVGSNVTFSATI